MKLVTELRKEVTLELTGAAVVNAREYEGPNRGACHVPTAGAAVTMSPDELKLNVNAVKLPQSAGVQEADIESALADGRRAVANIEQTNTCATQVAAVL